MKRKVLFVCGRNVDRSRTAEELFKHVEGWEVESAGVSFGATVPATKEMISWADIVFAMEYKHKESLIKIDFQARQNICVGNPRSALPWSARTETIIER